MLCKQVCQGKIPHTILLYGESAAALSEAAYQLATHVILLGSSDAEYKLFKRQHPDVLECFPEGKGRLYSIDLPRRIRREIWVYPFEANYKVYIIHDAHRMVVSALSAFLKLLEEPPAHSVFILTSTRLQAIPPTIRSRAFIVAVENKIQESLSEKEWQFVLQLAAGQIDVMRVGQIFKDAGDVDKQMQRDKARALLETLLLVIREKTLLSFKVSDRALAYPQHKKEIENLPTYALEKVWVVVESACKALMNFSSAASCMEWVALQLPCLKG